MFQQTVGKKKECAFSAFRISGQVGPWLYGVDNMVFVLHHEKYSPKNVKNTIFFKVVLLQTLAEKCLKSKHLFLSDSLLRQSLWQHSSPSSRSFQPSPLLLFSPTRQRGARRRQAIVIHSLRWSVDSQPPKLLFHSPKFVYTAIPPLTQMRTSGSSHY